MPTNLASTIVTRPHDGSPSDLLGNIKHGLSRESDTETGLKVDRTADFIYVVKAAVRGASVISGGTKRGVDGGFIVNLVVRDGTRSLDSISEVFPKNPAASHMFR